MSVCLRSGWVAWVEVFLGWVEKLSAEEELRGVVVIEACPEGYIDWSMFGYNTK